ncbi:MAG TPA: VOC family protein [Chthoniobacterales bacterium]
MKLIHPQARIGHLHLKVSDLERSLRFYRDVLGFAVTARVGDSAAFLSAGGYHDHIGLNRWESLAGSPPPALPNGGRTPPARPRPAQSDRRSVGA